MKRKLQSRWQNKQQQETDNQDGVSKADDAVASPQSDVEVNPNAGGERPIPNYPGPPPSQPIHLRTPPNRPKGTAT